MTDDLTSRAKAALETNFTTLDSIEDLYTLVRDLIAEVERLRAERDALIAAAYEDAASLVDCGCDNRTAVLAAKSNADRWRACSRSPCAALDARDILEQAPQSARDALAARDRAKIAEGMRRAADISIDDIEFSLNEYTRGIRDGLLIKTKAILAAADKLEQGEGE